MDVQKKKKKGWSTLTTVKKKRPDLVFLNVVMLVVSSIYNRMSPKKGGEGIKFLRLFFSFYVRTKVRTDTLSLTPVRVRFLFHWSKNLIYGTTVQPSRRNKPFLTRLLSFLLITHHRIVVRRPDIAQTVSVYTGVSSNCDISNKLRSTPLISSEILDGSRGFIWD